MAIGETARLISSLELEDKFSGPAKNAEGALGRLEGKAGLLGGRFKEVAAGLGQMGKGIGQVGSGFDKIITRGAVAAAAGLGAIITTAASFEQSEAGIRKTVGGTIEEVDALIASIKDMSRVVPLSFEELAAIAAEGGALGIATESLANFTDIVARLGVSTDLSTEQAASALGQMSNVLHLSDSDLRDFSDSLVALGNDGASTESQILDLATRFGAAGHQAGLSHEAILALASTTASMGIEAEAGGGALSRVFNGITLDIATATEEGQILADSMGLSLAELRTAWDQDAGAVFGDLLAVIHDLDQFQAAEFLSNLGITNVRDINAITLLASGVEEYNRQLGVSVGQTTELNKESDAFFNTTEGKWQIFQNNVRLAADVIGGELLPVVNEVLEDLVGTLSDPGTQASLKEFGENLAGGIRDFIGEIKRADFGPLLDVLKTTGAIAKGAFDAFRALPPEVQSLALAAFGINKVTGGALGDIAKGFGNIFAGGLKILFERGSHPGNPMWVQSVGGGVPGGAGASGGLMGLLGPLGLAIAGLTAFTIAGEQVFKGLFPEIHDFNELVAGTEGRPPSRAVLDNEMNALAAETGQSVDELRAEMIPLLQAGNLTWDQILAEIRNPRPGTVFGSTPLGQFNPKNLGGTRPFALPDTAVHMKDGGVVLPDTAMRPVTSGLGDVKTEVGRLPPILSMNSMAELGAIRAQTGRLDGINSQLSAIRNQGPPIINLSAPVSVSISATLLEQRLVTARVAAVGAYSATGAEMTIR